jgi:hypothetical protein
MQGFQALLGDRGLPSAVAAPLGELVEDAPGFGQRVFAALRNQQDVHCAFVPSSSAMALRLSIMKSSDSVRVKLSMQA